MPSSLCRLQTHRPSARNAHRACGERKASRDDELRFALYRQVRDQLIPSTTAVVAATTIAIAALSTVTVVASHHNSRSRPARKTTGRGNAKGMAGRISKAIEWLLLASAAGVRNGSAPRRKERQQG
jgi:hypothetical protein